MTLAPDDLARQLMLHTDWLQLVRQDPHLPAGQLPQDWPAISAEEVFRRLANRYAASTPPLTAKIESIPV